VDTPDERRGSYTLGVIAGKLQAIHQDVSSIKQTMVTQGACEERHDRIDTEMRRAFALARGTAVKFEKLKHDTNPNIKRPGAFDIWSWASTRLPVILALLAILGALYWLRASLDRSSATADQTARELRVLRKQVGQPTIPMPVPMPVPLR